MMNIVCFAIHYYNYIHMYKHYEFSYMGGRKIPY